MWTLRVGQRVVGVAMTALLIAACTSTPTGAPPAQAPLRAPQAGAAPTPSELGLAAWQAASALRTAQEPPAEPDWPTYHQDALRRGVGPATPTIGSVQPAWTAGLDGEVYAEPLVVGDMVITVTENDTVYALDVASGAVRWSQHLGEPVPRAALPCGNIDPSGFTATPVVDVGSGVVYAVGRMQPTHHELVALNLGTGDVVFRRTIDPAGADPRYLQERGALALANGRVYVPFGGNLGDCGPYRGAVIGVAADGAGDLRSYVVPTQREGAIWAPSGIDVDADGTLLIATGNADSTTAFDFANAVIRLSPDLQLRDYWAPANWAALSRSDTDIGSIGPAPLDGDQLFQTGKNGVGYLLRASSLGGIGGELFQTPICNARAFGGTAYQAPMLYVPCQDGLAALRIADGSFTVAWRSERLNLNAPIVAYGAVWTINTEGALLLQLDPASGEVRGRYDLGGPIVAHFLTPTASRGLIIAPAGHKLIAFGAS